MLISLNVVSVLFYYSVGFVVVCVFGVYVGMLNMVCVVVIFSVVFKVCVVRQVSVLCLCKLFCSNVDSVIVGFRCVLDIGVNIVSSVSRLVLFVSDCVSSVYVVLLLESWFVWMLVLIIIVINKVVLSFFVMMWCVRDGVVDVVEVVV